MNICALKLMEVKLYLPEKQPACSRRMIFEMLKSSCTFSATIVSEGGEESGINNYR